MIIGFVVVMAIGSVVVSILGFRWDLAGVFCMVVALAIGYIVMMVFIAHGGERETSGPTSDEAAATGRAFTSLMLLIGMLVFLGLPALALADNGGDHPDGWSDAGAAAAAAAGAGAVAAAGGAARGGSRPPRPPDPALGGGSDRGFQPQRDPDDPDAPQYPPNDEPERTDPALGGGSDRGFQPQRDPDDPDAPQYPPNDEPDEGPPPSAEDSPRDGSQPPSLPD